MEEQPRRATPTEEAVIEDRVHLLDNEEDLEGIDSLLDAL